MIGILLLQIDLEPFAGPAFHSSFSNRWYLSAKDGLSERIFDKHLSVDVLMILAAIGYWYYWLLDGGEHFSFLSSLFKYSGRIGDGKKAEMPSLH